MKQLEEEIFGDGAIEARLAASPELTPADDLKTRIMSRVAAGAECPSKEDAVILAPPSRSEKKRPLLLRVFSLAAAFLFVMAISFAVIYTYALEADVVYIDVNPSLELSLNRRDTIISVTYLNEDAETVFGDLDLRGQAIDEGLEEVMDALDQNGYMEKEDAEVNIAVYSRNEEKAEKRLSHLAAQVTACEQKHDRKTTVNTMEVSKDDKKEAGKKGISPNKYQFIKEIVDIDGQPPEGELSDMSVKDLKHLYDSLRGQSNAPGSNGGHANGRPGDYDDEDDRIEDDRIEDDRNWGHDHGGESTPVKAEVPGGTPGANGNRPGLPADDRFPGETDRHDAEDDGEEPDPSDDSTDRNDPGVSHPGNGRNGRVGQDGRYEGQATPDRSETVGCGT